METVICLEPLFLPEVGERVLQLGKENTPQAIEKENRSGYRLQPTERNESETSCRIIYQNDLSTCRDLCKECKN